MTEEWQHDLKPPVRLPDVAPWHSITDAFIQIGRAYGRSLAEASRMLSEAFLNMNVHSHPVDNSVFFGIEVSSDKTPEPEDPTKKVYPTSLDSWWNEYAEDQKLLRKSLRPRRFYRRR